MRLRYLTIKYRDGGEGEPRLQYWNNFCECWADIPHYHILEKDELLYINDKTKGTTNEYI